MVRAIMLDALPAGGRIAEIGVLAGEFSRQILDRCQPRCFDLVDVDFSQLRSDVRAAPAVTLHQGLSHEVLAGFEDRAFDWIYIDADHSCRGIRSDIEAAAPKVRRDGYLVFNDFARIVRPGLGVFGVHQAVSEFIVRERWQVTHFCMHPEALYDIALRRPY